MIFFLRLFTSFFSQILEPCWINQLLDGLPVLSYYVCFHAYTFGYAIMEGTCIIFWPRIVWNIEYVE